MELTVLVPDERGEQALMALVGDAGVRVLRYDPTEPFPPGAEQAEVLVPPLLATAALTERIPTLPRLRLVQLLTVGADGWLGRLPDRLALSTARGAHTAATSEWVLMALLAVYRGLPEFLADARERRWQPRPTRGMAGRKVLVIGAGDVGRAVRRRLLACECTVTMVGRRGGDGVHPVSALLRLLGEHDAVVLIVPLTDQTRGMVDAGFLAAMPDGAVLVNAARGRVVDTEALLAELRTGRLTAALDVTDPEPPPDDHPLWTVPNLLVTPHVGGTVVGMFDRAYRVAAAQITAFAAGKEPPNLVRDGY